MNVSLVMMFIVNKEVRFLVSESYVCTHTQHKYNKVLL